MMNRFWGFSDPTEILSIMDEIDSDESYGEFDGYLEGSYTHCIYVATINNNSNSNNK